MFLKLNSLKNSTTAEGEMLIFENSMYSSVQCQQTYKHGLLFSTKYLVSMVKILVVYFVCYLLLYYFSLKYLKIDEFYIFCCKNVYCVTKKFGASTNLVTNEEEWPGGAICKDIYSFKLSMRQEFSLYLCVWWFCNSMLRATVTKWQAGKPGLQVSCSVIRERT